MTHDEMIAVIAAHKEGKKIEYRYAQDESWRGCGSEPMWDFSETEYRVKPEPHYRPFNSAEEVANALDSHGGYIKFGDDIIVYPSILHNDRAEFGTGNLLYYPTIEEDIIKSSIKFADGTPFGKLEE